MPLWSISLALAAGPPLATCDPAITPLSTLIADPAVPLIHLEAGCDHVLPASVLTRALTMEGEPGLTGTAPRVVPDPAMVNGYLFTVNAGGDLTLRGFTLTGEGRVGGVFANQGPATLTDMLVHDTQEPNGSAVYVGAGASFVAERTTFSLGVAGSLGGHIATYGPTTLTDVSFDGGRAAFGGSIYADDSATLSVVGAVATDNQADWGGWLFNRATAARIEGLVSTDHHATTQNGGAIYSDSGTLTLCTSVLSDGSAAQGGAIWTNQPLTIGVDPQGDPCPASTGLAGVDMSDHSANDGGSIYATNTISLHDSRIDGGAAVNDGGLVYATGALDLARTTLAAGSAGRHGGCLYATANVSATELTLDACLANQDGGGAYATSTLTATDLSVTDSVALGSGGGLFFTGGQARDLAGLTVTGCFAGNDGGGLSQQAMGASTTTLRDAWFVDNAAGRLGGAIATRESPLVLDDFRLHDNVAAFGGAVAVAGAGTVTMSRGLVCDSGGATGAVYLDDTGSDAVLTATQLAFVHNDAVTGGAVAVRGGSTFVGDRLHLMENTAEQGSALSVDGESAGSLARSVVAGNVAGLASSGALEGGTCDGTCWFEGNLPTANPAEPSLIDVSAGLIAPVDCDWASLRNAVGPEVNGVFASFVGAAGSVPTTEWLDGDDPLRDADSDGVPWVSDCDDDDPTRHHGAPEICNGIDDDCDGRIDDDDDDTTGRLTWYGDADVDGRGDLAVTVAACEAPEGYVDNGDDCAPTDNTLPGPIYADLDSDGLGAGDRLRWSCTNPGDSESGNAQDCDDTDPAVRAAVPLFEDGDRDGFGAASVAAGCPDVSPSLVAQDGDCDDNRSDVFPGAPEVCDGVDQDCNDAIDDGAGLPTWVDADQDGVGTGEPTLSCDTEGVALIGGDCDDTDPARTSDCGQGGTTVDPTEPTPTGTDGMPLGTAQAGCSCGTPAPAAPVGLLLLLPLVRRRR